MRSIHFLHFRMQAEDGGTLVEFALCSCVLFLVVFGIMGLSVAVYSDFVVADIAREATRYAMVRGSTFTSDCTAPGYATCIAQTGDIQTYARSLTFPGLTISNLTVTTTWLNSAGGSCGTDDSCKAPGNFVKTTVAYPYPLMIPFVPHQTLNLKSTSEMAIAQ